MTIFIPLSKTDVYREGNIVYINSVDSKYCPVNLVKKYTKAAGISFESNLPLFRPLIYYKSNSYSLRSSKLSYFRCREVFKPILYKRVRTRSDRHRGEGGAGGALAPPLFGLIKLFQFFSKVLHKKVHRVFLCQTCGPQRKHCFFLIAPFRFNIDFWRFSWCLSRQFAEFGTFKESDFKISG